MGWGKGREVEEEEMVRKERWKERLAIGLETPGCNRHCGGTRLVSVHASPASLCFALVEFMVSGEMPFVWDRPHLT